jgi:ArsR family transcriptional regulator, arsenate/arsenite/antimonite-responsive transcriptional repressor
MNTLLRQQAETFAALADSNRLRLLKCLQMRPCCVCELMQATGFPQSRISRHLKTLRDAGLVVDERDAQWVVYRLAPEDVAGAAKVLAVLTDCLEDDPEVKADRRRLKTARRQVKVA